jgi:hypothetical protein
MTPSAAYAADIDTTEFDEHLPEIELEKVQHFRQIADGDIVIRSVTEADLPEKFRALLRSNAKFRDSWNKNRPEFENQSRSTYELSLAMLAALCGDNFTAQEICDLLVAFRYKWNGPRRGKAHYRCTIAKALGRAEQRRKEKQEAEGAFSPASYKQAMAEKDPEVRRQKSLAALNSLSIFERFRFEGFTRAGSSYVARIFTPHDGQTHKVQLGSAKELNGFVEVQARILRATGVNINLPSRKKAIVWTPAVELMVAIADSQPPDFEDGPEQEMKRYLSHALRTLAARDLDPLFSDPLIPIDTQNSEMMYWINLRILGGTRGTFLSYNDVTRPPWPRFVFWSVDGRLYVHLAMLHMFLGTPIGGNEKNLTVDQLYGLATFLEFELSRVITGEGENCGSASAEWAISPAGFTLNCEVAPQSPREATRPSVNGSINGSIIGSINGNVPLAMGDLVAWRRGSKSRGYVWGESYPIRGFSPDHAIAFFDENVSRTGIPVRELLKTTNTRSFS